MKSFFLSLLLLLFSVQSAQAASFTLPNLSLELDYPDDLRLLDYSSEMLSSQEHLIEAQRIMALGYVNEPAVMTFIFTSDEIESLLETVQLHFVNPQESSNTELFGRTAIRIVGTDFEEGFPKDVYLLPLGERNLVVEVPKPDERSRAILESWRKVALFPDIAQSPFRADIEWVTDQGIFSGTERDGQKIFLPNDSITRAAFMKVLMLLLYGDEELQNRYDQLIFSSITAFPDVDASAWFAPYIFVSQNEGISKGYPDGSFRPADPVIGAEALKLVASVFEPDLSDDPDEWFRSYLNDAVEKAVLIEEGAEWFFAFSDQRFPLHEAISREQIAALLARYAQVDESFGLYGIRRQSYGLGVQSSEDILLEVDARRSELPNRSEFVTMKDSTLYVFSPEVWTAFERQRDPSQASLYVHDESRSKVLVSTQDDLSKLRFTVRPQDLLALSDPQIPFEMHSAEELRLQIDRSDADRPLFQLLSGEELKASFQAFYKDDREVSSFFEEDPIAATLIGNQLWYQYQRSDRLDMVSVFDDWTLVASYEGLNSAQELTGNQQRILRTLQLVD